MEKFCDDLKYQTMKIINYEKKREIALTNEEKESYEKQKESCICEEKFCADENNEEEFKLYCKVRDHNYYTVKFRGHAYSKCSLNNKTQREIPVVIHSGSTYDYHFIIKQLAKEFNGEIKCLGEKTEKYITFSVPLKKELKNKKNNYIKNKN